MIKVWYKFIKKEKMATRNRGKLTKDTIDFGKPSNVVKLLLAVDDLSYLLEKNYGIKAALQLVGNRYLLNERQQKAVRGMAASDTNIKIRKEKQITNLKGKVIIIDAFNLLITLESLLSGAFLFKGRDGCFRDLSSVHGTYKRVLQTENVLKMIGQACLDLEIEKALWVFDKPVSNSGRMKVMLYDIAKENGFPWHVILDYNPDKYLVDSNAIIVSSDAWILNNCKHWFNMIAYLLKNYITQKVFIIDATIKDEK